MFWVQKTDLMCLQAALIQELPQLWMLLFAMGKLKGIIGGLHDSEEFERLKEMELIAAGHCTAHREKIKDAFPSEL